MKKRVKISRKTKTESLDKLMNIPNTLSIARILLTFIIIYLIITKDKISTIIFIFVIAALTDFFDGQIARKFHQKTEFGRKTDMIADRFLWIGTALAFIISLFLSKETNALALFQLIIIMSREIISAPIAIYALIKQKPIPKAIFIAKLTTFLQGFAIPLIILSLFYGWITYISLPLSIIICITGAISGIQYIKDIKRLSKF